MSDASLSLLIPFDLVKFLTMFPITSMHLFLAAVVNNIHKTKDHLTVPITTAEFTVMKTACSV